MNVMFKIGERVVTPSLADGSILPGITRKSCIEMMRSWGMAVEERKVGVDELTRAAEDGTLEEAWGTGTAAVISPIGELSYGGKSYVVNGTEIGPTSRRLYDELTGLQWGSRPDPFGWTVPIPKS